MEHWSKIYSNSNTLKSQTKKLNHLNHNKGTEDANLWLFSRQMQEVDVPKEI